MKVKYTEFEIESGIVRRRGYCMEDQLPTPRKGCSLLVGVHINPETEKIECGGVDENGVPINPKVTAYQKPEMPVSVNRRISRKEFNDLLHRVEELESRI